MRTNWSKCMTIRTVLRVRKIRSRNWDQCITAPRSEIRKLKNSRPFCVKMPPPSVRNVRKPKRRPNSRPCLRLKMPRLRTISIPGRTASKVTVGTTVLTSFRCSPNPARSSCPRSRFRPMIRMRCVATVKMPVPPRMIACNPILCRQHKKHHQQNLQSLKTTLKKMTGFFLMTKSTPKTKSRLKSPRSPMHRT